MPSAKYYIAQARTLLTWARATPDKDYARGLSRKASELLEQANDAHPAVADLNPLLTDFNDTQMRKGPEEGSTA